MKLLLLGNGFLSIAHQELYIAAALKARGHEVKVVHDPAASIINKNHIPEVLNQEDIIVKKHGDASVEKSLDTPDLILGLDQSMAMSAYEYKMFYKVPTACIFLDYPKHIIDEGSPADYDEDYSANYYESINLGNALDGMIFSNRVSAFHVAPLLDLKPYFFYYPVCTTDIFDGLANLAETEELYAPYVATAHKFYYYKGTEYLIKALHEIDVEYKAVCAGGMLEAQTIAFGERMLGDRFLPLIRVPEESKWDAIRKASVLCFPSLTGWSGGMAVLEAMYAGTPVICSDFTTYREMFGDCVIYAKPKDIDDLQSKILQVLNWDVDVAGLVEKAKKKARAEFSLSKAGEIMTKILEHIRNEHSNRS